MDMEESRLIRFTNLAGGALQSIQALKGMKNNLNCHLVFLLLFRIECFLVSLRHQALRPAEVFRNYGQGTVKECSDLPTTGQLTPYDFTEAFRRLTENGDEVVAITLSSKLFSAITVRVR